MALGKTATAARYITIRLPIRQPIASSRCFATSAQWQAEPPRVRPRFQDPRPLSQRTVAVEDTASPVRPTSAEVRPTATETESSPASSAASASSSVPEPSPASTSAESSEPVPASPPSEQPIVASTVSTTSVPPTTSTTPIRDRKASLDALFPKAQPEPLATTPTNLGTNSQTSNILGSMASRLAAKNSAGTTTDYGVSGSMVQRMGLNPSGPDRPGDNEYHLHVYSTRHNTHLTLAGTSRNTIISISAGNLGFRKSQRGTYDAAYQLMAYLMNRIQQQGILPKIQKLELCLRGFGQGREAVVKVLTGSEGGRLRDAIVRVVDKTRLKIGGTRSPAPRRLG